MTIVEPVLVLPTDSLPDTEMKQQISIAYVRMVVAAAGCTVLSWDTDYDGVDISIKSSAEYNVRLGPQIDIQLKCTSQTKVVREDEIAWSIDARTHKYLTSPKRQTPALLALLVVPDDVDGWLDHDESRLLTASSMYWVLGLDIPELPDGQQSITVKIPRANLFTRDALLGIMHAVGEGWIGGH
ncbi:DUF4365 domain-containing protein [Rhodococcus sp. RCBS9]|uniref:DUF4365 domain-containing protein n=1 Tax=Rhodococcus sp. RCBS9 TaxID=3031999 RepID=UPI002402B570|nr:DUF4365 domain-containing protein [Rhodococcus sp. RCBS9]WEX03825.1 DUF4365 domain-containing protein [Rhodococcus sp. RCBS9]WEX03904.1 DUF4365 domain-containing protein [Rhodococcus sp. RCBS9]